VEPIQEGLEQNVDVEDGRIVAWKVDLLVTFVLE
jgi:hypothetical protein